MSDPRLWLTSMSGPDQVGNITEMVEPVLSWLDGVVWVLNDCPADDAGAQYLESVKGAGRVIHRPWPSGRHNVSMNDTFYCGPIEEGDYVLWVDAMEHPMAPFVSRIKGEIGPMMQEADLDILGYYGKAYLIRYRETMEYRGSPHWYLTGHNGSGIEWSTVEPNEKLVRFNARPLKRTVGSGHHWTTHYAKYWLYPAGSNHALLGIEQHGGDPNEAFTKRDARRLEFRQEMRRRGHPLTLDGLRAMLMGPLDEVLRGHLNAEKTLSDVYHYWHGRAADLKDTHKPTDAIPVL